MARTSSPHLVQAYRHWRVSALLILALLASGLGFCGWEARLPDETLSFSRETTTRLAPATLSRKIETISEWKTWFHSLQDAQILDSQNHPLPADQQKAFTGAHLELLMDPGKGAKRRFRLAAEIVQYTPGKFILIRVTDDSSGKIFKLFDQLEWTIEIAPDSPETARILGTETAHTAHWRSRLFGRIAPRVILNQLFYPNLLVLANPETPPKAEGIF